MAKIAQPCSVRFYLSFLIIISYFIMEFAIFKFQWIRIANLQLFKAHIDFWHSIFFQMIRMVGHQCSAVAKIQTKLIGPLVLIQPLQALASLQILWQYGNYVAKAFDLGLRYPPIVSGQVIECKRGGKMNACWHLQKVFHSSFIFRYHVAPNAFSPQYGLMIDVWTSLQVCLRLVASGTCANRSIIANVIAPFSGAHPSERIPMHSLQNYSKAWPKVGKYQLEVRYSTYNINPKEQTMNNPALKDFNDIIKTLSTEFKYKRIIATAQKRYLIKHLNVQTLNPLLVSKIVERNLNRDLGVRLSHGANSSSLNEVVWALNQFKVFAWISLSYAILKDKQLHNFVQSDFEFLQALFPSKSAEFLEYHLKSFDKQYKNSRPEWEQRQTALLVHIISQQQNEGGGLVWGQVSYRLFVESQKQFYRSPQKCRQIWNNHLSPVVNRCKWSLEEDIKLFKCIRTYSLKWASISKEFGGSRTEHMIKNRYNSLLRKFGGRSHRHSQKKIIQRIEADLQDRITKGELEQEQAAQEEGQEEAETKCLLPKDEKLPGNIHKQAKGELPAPRFELGYLDLEEILFSETIAAIIDDPLVFTPKLELLEVQPERDNCYGEEYLSSFLY